MIIIPVKELTSTADEFQQAGQNIDAIIKKLEEHVTCLQETWDDAGKQSFMQYFKEWRHFAGGSTQLLQTIATEMHAIAERYSEADQ